MYHLFVDNKVIKSALGLFKRKMLLRPNPAGSNFWLWLGVFFHSCFGNVNSGWQGSIWLTAQPTLGERRNVQ